MEVKQFEADEKGESELVKTELACELEKLCWEKNHMMHQKSRVQWNSQGDRKSKFFHTMARYKWNKNQILGVNWQNNWVSSPEGLRVSFFNYFEAFFKRKYPRPVFTLGGLVVNKISDVEALILDKEFSLLELDEALKFSASNRAPGPDGTSAGALKKIWPFVRNDLLKCFLDFQIHGYLPKGMNATFISLIPKCESPYELKEFRPISLINASMKLLTSFTATKSYPKASF